MTTWTIRKPEPPPQRPSSQRQGPASDWRAARGPTAIPTALQHRACAHNIRIAPWAREVVMGDSVTATSEKPGKYPVIQTRKDIVGSLLAQLASKTCRSAPHWPPLRHRSVPGYGEVGEMSFCFPQGEACSLSCNDPKLKKDVKKKKTEKAKRMENIHHSPFLWCLNCLIHSSSLYRNFQAIQL